MADNIIKVNVTSNKQQRVTVSSAQVGTEITASSDTGKFWAQNSKNWAVSENIVDNTDYSSKYYANVSKNHAKDAKEYLETTIDNYNNFVVQSSESLGQISELKNSATEEILSFKDSAIDNINSTKTTILNDIEFVADGEKEEIKDLVELIKDNAEDIINRVGISMFDTILKDHVLTYEESKGLALQGTYVYKQAIAGSRYGYPDFYNKCLEERNTATATQVTLAGSTITMYIASNGHQYYDIANKDVVDEFFGTMGTAWFYGIDTENERIFLPRNNYFDQLTGDASEVGLSVEAGLPNITGSATSTGEGGFSWQTFNVSGAFTKTSNNGTLDTSGKGASAPKGLGFDASKSNSIYGNSDTVQPNAVKKLLYICVGNTESVSSVTNVIDITTTENDTIPLGFSTYQNGAQASVSWLKSEGQWSDGNVYKTFYNEFVQKIGQAFAGGYVVEYTSDYTDYDLVVNQDNMTFRLPLLDGSEDLPSDKYTNLTLGSSGNTYIAPANGWVYLQKDNGGTNNYCQLKNETTQMSAWATRNSASVNNGCYLPVAKGDTYSVIYTATGTTNAFKFIYAQGNGSLYFKVANAVQNLELLNVGEVMEAVNNVVPNNKELITGYAFPSSKYIDLTAGASGTTYTAPANGWFALNTYVSGAWVALLNSSNNMREISPKVSSLDMSCMLPVCKGDEVLLNYDGSWSPYTWQPHPFIFVYAKGSEGEV